MTSREEYFKSLMYNKKSEMAELMEYDTMEMINEINAQNAKLDSKWNISHFMKHATNTMKQMDKKEKLRERLRIKLEAKK